MWRLTLALFVSAILSGCAVCEAVEVGDRQVVLDTLIGEGIGEGERGMEAIAEVIANRAKRSGRTMSEECLRPKQFSFWNDRQRAKRWLNRYATPSSYKQASNALKTALNGASTVGDSRHYYANYIKTPKWVKGATKTYAIGRHIFLEGIQ